MAESEKREVTRVQKQSPPQPDVEHIDVRLQKQRDILLLAFCWRLLCALTVCTFFQPDEYYQSLEPAWSLSFGRGSGAWITWEWKHGLRSSIHPFLVSALYTITSRFCYVVGVPVTLRATALIYAPRVLHGLLTTYTDYFTWRLAERLFGRQSNVPATAFGLILLSPWQWFIGLRPFANVVEAFLSTYALYLWPWSWIMYPIGAKEKQADHKWVKYSLAFAALACALRPTNILMWLPLLSSVALYATQDETIYLLQQIALVGPGVYALSLSLDRLYYGDWVIPAIRFWQYNLQQNIAVFYGRNRVDYYFTEGLPILLTLLLPFSIIGVVRGLQGQSFKVQDQPIVQGFSDKQLQTKTIFSPFNPKHAIRTLALVTLVVPLVLSLIGHKEVRFLHPILPVLTILAASPFESFFKPVDGIPTVYKRYLFALFVIISSTIAIYVSYMHQRGALSVTVFLREQFTRLNGDALVVGTRDAGPSSLWQDTMHPDKQMGELRPLTAAFLMPCHSTPWRSHLVFPEIKAWALTCEPPLNLDPATRATYLDEADSFYVDPAKWLQGHMKRVPADKGTWTDEVWDGREPRPWPRCLLFFEQLEPEVAKVLGAKGSRSRYREAWRGFNSHWHDDWRRSGDVVAWCIDGGEGPLDQEVEEYRERRIRESTEREARGQRPMPFFGLF